MDEAGKTKEEGWKRYVIVISVVIGLVFAALYTKVYVSSRSEYRQALEASDRQDLKRAITHYQRSIQWYAPWNRYVEGSARRLWEIGQAGERRGESELALEAYRAVRSGILSTRSLYTPHADWVERCNERIAWLEAAKPPSSKANEGKSFEQRKADRLQLLHKTHAPDPFWSFVLEVGFLGWIGGALAFIFKAITEEGGLHRRRALYWGGVIVACYALWIIGMARA